MQVGIDDTDSPQGGCTTWVLTELTRVARSHGLDLIGEPRLVRLNPNVPWKTRGNAALALRVGHGRGRPVTVGEVDGRVMTAYPRGSELTDEEARRFLRDAWRRVREVARSERGTDPALVAVRGRLPPSLYWNAVRERVRLAPVERALTAAEAVVRVRGGRRGVIGAAAAVAWPGRRRTWELIAYRRSDRLGTRRDVDRASVVAAQRAHPSLFLCHDPRTRRLLVAPHTACPILFGLRATRRSAPLAARARVRSEPVERWMLFRTNQATGDHLLPRAADALGSYRSGIVEGTVVGAPQVRPGGHVRFDLTDRAGGRLRCIAFEPTKTLPAVARGLRAGDRLRVWGSLGRARSFRLEGIQVVAVARDRRREPPNCPACGRRSRSLGRDRGWRCDACRRRFPPEAAGAAPVRRTVRPGTYHPTPSARRHLAPRERDASFRELLRAPQVLS